MKNDKFQENLSRPGIIDAAARRLRNTTLHPLYVYLGGNYGWIV